MPAWYGPLVLLVEQVVVHSPPRRTGSFNICRWDRRILCHTIRVCIQWMNSKKRMKTQKVNNCADHCAMYHWRKCISHPFRGIFNPKWKWFSFFACFFLEHFKQRDHPTCNICSSSKRYNRPFWVKRVTCRWQFCQRAFVPMGTTIIQGPRIPQPSICGRFFDATFFKIQLLMVQKSQTTTWDV